MDREDEEYVGCSNPFTFVASWWSNKKRIATENDLLEAQKALNRIVGTVSQRVKRLENDMDKITKEIRAEGELCKKARLKEEKERHKKKAFTLMKRRQMKQMQVDKIQAYLESVEVQSDRLEQLHVTLDVVDANKIFLKNTKGVISDSAIKKLETTINSISDAQENLAELDQSLQSLSNTLTSSATLDEVALEQELEQIMNEETEPEIVSTTFPKTPSVLSMDASPSRPRTREEELNLMDQ